MFRLFGGSLLARVAAIVSCHHRRANTTNRWAPLRDDFIERPTRCIMTDGPEPGWDIAFIKRIPKRMRRQIRNQQIATRFRAKQHI